MTTDKIRKDKNQNIQVFIRLRPLNQRERDIKSLGVIEVVNNREVVVRQSQQTSHTKKFTFDRAFGPGTSQIQVYQEVVSPLIEEVLAGYNCTVFAYGQTGTGKTHTMVGEHSGSETTWQNDPLAGIIPRALSQLFDELRLTNTEYTVRVSYLELYNEELFDLLSSSEDNSKLRIYEDVTRKGSNIVNGLEEITVYNKNEVYKIMAQGQERKRVASTLMNAQSSRSHTVFTIVVHMKENSPEGEELVKIGKLNLVDLAGSENISKAGSDNPAKKERARECVNINQSLLTLGRVITALVERHPHIPYRESKLTRILQESLGGRTKTSIIATISPGHKDLEETMSTLEYAHRAKNIQNKPEINQKMTKKAILKEYAEEIDRLKRDLQAARDKNGVYLASETFAEMTLKQEEQNKEIQELLLKKRAMEEEKNRMEDVFGDLNQTLESKNMELATTKNQLSSTKAELASTSKSLVRTRRECEEQAFLVQHQRSTEQALARQARELLQAADQAATHVACLHDTVDKRKTVESTNLEVTRTYREESSQKREEISSGVREFSHSVTSTLATLQNALDAYTTTSIQTQEQNKQQLENLLQTFVDTVNEIKSAASQSHSGLVESTSTHRSCLRSSVSEHCSSLQAALATFLASFASSLQSAESVDVKGSVATFVQQWYLGAAARVASLQKAHKAWGQRSGQSEDERAQAHLRQREHRRGLVARRQTKAHACLADMEEETRRIEARLSQQLSSIEDERQATETRLQKWMEEERRSLEERLAKHAATERDALEQRLAGKVQEIEEEKKLLEERMTRYKEWQQAQVDADKEELEMADRDLEENDRGREECLNHAKRFGKEFDEGTNAISVDMEMFSKNVVEVVEHINEEMLRMLQQTKHHVEEQVKNVLAADEATSAQFVQQIDSTLDGVVCSTKDMLDHVVGSVEAKHTTAIDTISGVAASSAEAISLSRSYAASWRQSKEEGAARAAALQDGLRDALAALAQLEGRYLAQEYRLYSPTGKTPSRVAFRFPRQLVTTSPHQRVLARFRAQRGISHSDDECVVVDSDNEPRQASDSECSTSEDSAVFAAPSPPLANNRSANNIFKSTSETDIYSYKKQQQEQSKENTIRSASHKKPSKLPAPSSNKKPLAERNGTVN